MLNHEGFDARSLFSGCDVMQIKLPSGLEAAQEW